MLGARDVYLVAEVKTNVLRPGIVEMRGSNVFRLQLYMKWVYPPRLILASWQFLSGEESSPWETVREMATHVVTGTICGRLPFATPFLAIGTPSFPHDARFPMEDEVATLYLEVHPQLSPP